MENAVSSCVIIKMDGYKMLAENGRGSQLLSA